jgi:two-component system, NtrC family, response regulator HydG
LAKQVQVVIDGAGLDEEPRMTLDRPKPTILLVDDEASNLESLERILLKEGLDVLRAPGGKEALDIVRKRRVDLVLTDLMMPGMTGVDLLKAVRQLSAETEVVVMTAYGSVENAVEAMREGAYDFLTKPLKRAHVLAVVGKVIEKLSLVVENRALKAQLEATKRRPIVGQSLAMRRTLEVVSQAAPSVATVLLLGESGTGKELLARQIHEQSPRAGRSFIAVNCAAIPEGILEGELFGYEKGAFTGAVERRPGRFAMADGGTLFLDEIGEIPLAMQVKLLRVLQEGEVERLGGKTHKVDIRLVAATNRDLRRAVKEGSFREDLFYRLNVIALTVPPLRERRDDVPLLVEHFLQRFRDKNQKAVAGCTRAAMDALAAYPWPGNVRELENAIERAVVLCRSNVIDVDDLPREILGAPAADAGSANAIRFEIGTPLDEIELRMIHETLRHTKGDKRLAAQLLGIATRTIYRKLGQPESGGSEPDPATPA